MSQQDALVFLAELETVFQSFLPSSFRFRKDMVEETPLYIRAPFIGKNVALVFVYDIREQLVDCYVARVADGRIVRESTFNGSWHHLHSLLVKRSGFRGTIKNRVLDKDPSQREFQRILAAYAQILKSHGAFVLEDTPLAR
jgi:hypothetical protein